MVRGGTILCFVLAHLACYCAQDFLPCGDDNLACVRSDDRPITDVCYNRSQLCDGDFLCELGEDEGNRGEFNLDLVNALDCKY